MARRVTEKQLRQKYLTGTKDQFTPETRSMRDSISQVRSTMDGRYCSEKIGDT
jgi:hypothetical protein